LTHRDNLVTITISTAFSRIRGDQGAWFHRSTRLTPPINLIDTGHADIRSLFRSPTYFDLAAPYAQVICFDLLIKEALDKERME
jgi:hypothetical protein